MFIFTALHGMQTRSSDEISVCPSVCPSVKRVHCDKTEEKSVQIFIPCERTQGSHFLECQGMSGKVREFCFNWNVRELSGNFDICQGIFMESGDAD